MNKVHHIVVCGLVVVVSACTGSRNSAPVVDRLPARHVEAGGANAPVAGSAVDGIYTVKAGDTLYSIAMEFGLDWPDLSKLNNLNDSSKIYVGQKIRLPGGATSGTSVTSVVDGADSGVEVTPIPSASGGKVSPVNPTPATVATPPSPVVETKVEAPKPNLANANMGFIWPHSGELLQAFKAGTNKGIDVAAKVGDPVVAAQAGKVVYSGDGLRGYGNLVIIKHDNNLLTAYAHNKTLLVQNGDPVTKGQKIAEAGQSDANRPKLHFEVRKQGKPVDPMDYLPHR